MQYWCYPGVATTSFSIITAGSNTLHIAEKTQFLFKSVKLAVFDVDGVLTDGKIYYTDSGIESKAFNTQDGAAIKMLQSTGVQVALITGRRSEMVTRRAQDLDISHVYQGVSDKRTALKELEQNSGVGQHLMSHTGDDLNDLILFEHVGLSISVPGAHPVVQEAADYVTTSMPGMGAVREVCQLLMICQGTWDEVLKRYKA